VHLSGYPVEVVRVTRVVDVARIDIRFKGNPIICNFVSQVGIYETLTSGISAPIIAFVKLMKGRGYEIFRSKAGTSVCYSA
jgi:hypothetical protein